MSGCRLPLSPADYNAFAGALDDLVSTTLHLPPHLASDALGHTSATSGDVAVELGAEARPKSKGGDNAWATSGAGGDDDDVGWGDFEVCFLLTSAALVPLLRVFCHNA